MSTTTPIDPTRTLRDVIAELPGAVRVFEVHGLDYCCGGGARLSDAALDAGADLQAILGDLVEDGPTPQPDWATMSPTELVDHIESTHHAYVRSEMPVLTRLADKVAGVHGERHPELHDVRRTFRTMCADLGPHLVKEERMLFPAARELDGATELPWFPFGRASGPMSVMSSEHDVAGALLARLRELTDGYQVPTDACDSYRLLYEGLAAFEADLHLHVHKENNVLFPKIARLEQDLAAACVAGP